MLKVRLWEYACLNPILNTYTNHTDVVSGMMLCAWAIWMKKCTQKLTYKKIMMTQLDKNYNEYTCISSALEKVWLPWENGQGKVGTVISLRKGTLYIYVTLMAKLPGKMLFYWDTWWHNVLLTIRKQSHTSNPFTSIVRSCKGPTACNCLDVFSPNSRSEQRGNQRAVKKYASVHCSPQPTVLDQLWSWNRKRILLLGLFRCP